MNKNSRALRKKFFQKKIPIYRKKPVLFAQEVLLFEPDDWQKKALMDLAENPKVSIKSGQGVGKTGLEAVALLWFLCCYPYPRIVATAPTKQQLHDVLWSEVSKWMSKSPLLSEILKWTKTYIYIIRNLTGEYKKIEPNCREGVRVQLERMKELYKERNNLYEKQNDLKEKKQKIEKSLER